MKNKQNVKQIIERLEKIYPDAQIALKYNNPLELLIATILSSQCTDEVVNRVTPKLFSYYKTANDYAGAGTSELEQFIRPTGFYRNKARNIIKAARIIASKHNGEVPDTMSELVALPGVARKTANVVLYNAFNTLEGIAVDTHVKRLSNLLGLSSRKEPEKIERDLIDIVPRIYWGRITYLLIQHGREVCIARRPRCSICTLSDICPSHKTSYESRAKDQG